MPFIMALNFFKFVIPSRSVLGTKTLIYWGQKLSLHRRDTTPTGHVRLNVVPLDLGAEVAFLQRPVPSTKSQKVFC